MTISLMRVCAPLLAALVASACSPVTRVILLPQASGASSAVVVTSAQGTTTLDQPYAAVELDPKGRQSAATSSSTEVRERYPSLLALQPAAPQRFILNFLPGTSDLTPESESQLASVIQAAQARSGGEILIVGHTDRQGDTAANDALSLKRAQAIRTLFLSRGFRADLLSAAGRGEREPLVATEDNVAEPRNRRAEIIVR